MFSQIDLEKISKEGKNRVDSQIEKIEKVISSIFGDFPGIAESVNEILRFYKTELTEELINRSAKMELKVIGILMLNAIPLSNKLSDFILSIPKMLSENGVYIEGIDNPENRPDFIKEYLNEIK